MGAFLKFNSDIISRTPVIFLDIDGVLATRTEIRQGRTAGTIMVTTACGMVLIREANHDLTDPAIRDKINQNEEAEEIPMYGFSSTAVENLNFITKETGAVIVISSSWRKGFEFNSLCEFIAKQGVSGHIVGLTDSSGPHRGSEITRFVEAYGITKYIAIDDEDGLEDIADRVIKTNFEDGLTITGAEEAARLLA